MKNRQSCRKSNASRFVMLCGMLARVTAWGVVELLALQRCRFHAWRDRRHGVLSPQARPGSR